MDSPKKRTEQDIINELCELIGELDWVMGIPDTEDVVSGLVIGTREYVEATVEKIYGPGYAVFEEDSAGQIQETPPSKKSTLH